TELVDRSGGAGGGLVREAGGLLEAGVADGEEEVVFVREVHVDRRRRDADGVGGGAGPHPLPAPPVDEGAVRRGAALLAEELALPPGGASAVGDPAHGHRRGFSRHQGAEGQRPAGSRQGSGTSSGAEASGAEASGSSDSEIPTRS